MVMHANPMPERIIINATSLEYDKTGYSEHIHHLKLTIANTALTVNTHLSDCEKIRHIVDLGVWTVTTQRATSTHCNVIARKQSSMYYMVKWTAHFLAL